MKSVKYLAFILLFPMVALSGGLVEKTVDYEIDGKSHQGFFVIPQGHEKLPAVLVVHDWLGLTEKTKEKSRAVADLGYAVFAADVYGKDAAVKSPEEGGKISSGFKSDRKKFRKHLWAAYDAMIKQERINKEKTAAIGYCFGGTGVLEMARSGDKRLKGVVSFHGGLDAPQPRAKRFSAKVLALHGADDPFVKAEDLSLFEQELRDAKADWQLIKYGGAVHSFTDKSAGTDNSKGAAYNETADKRSWTELKTFLTETF